MNRSLDGVEAKLRQAKRHMYAFRDAYAQVRSSDPVRMVLVKDDQGGSQAYFIEVEHFPELPRQLGVIVGDAVHCFRSALDHLVWEAGRQNTGKGSTRSMFPFATSAADFRSQCNKIADLPTDQQAVIERMQPFNRAGPSSPFRALQQLSNTDKHRVLNPMLTEGLFVSEGRAPQGVNCTVEHVEWLGAGERLQIGSKVARLRLSGGGTDPHVQLEGTFIPDVAFAETNESVIGTLLGIGSECLLVVTEFERMLEPRPGPAALHRGQWRRWPIFNSWPYPVDV